MQTRTLSTLVAVFSSDAKARLAADDLKANGIPAGDIFITAANTTDANENVAHEYRHHEGGIKGWFHSLFGEDEDDSNRAASSYEQAVNTGNVLLSVDTSEQNIDLAADILNRHSPVDVHRDASVDDTYTDTYAGSDTYTGANTGSGTFGSTARQNTFADADVEDTPATGSGSTFRNRDTSEEDAGDAIPVVREELKVGKRAILRGGVRVYSRVVEQPVEETVGLREEHVRVDRTPVNREASNADLLRSGQQKVIEVKEYAEEPVVSKTARVVEEVRVRKESSERNETIRDTVRNTEVNVENIDQNTTGGQTNFGQSTGSTSGFGTGTAPAYENDYSSDFRSDFNQRYAASGETYDTYEPAYNYGYQAANDPRYRGRGWDQIENDLRSDYSTRYPNSTWDKVKNSVRYGWDRLTNRS